MREQIVNKWGGWRDKMEMKTKRLLAILTGWFFAMITFLAGIVVGVLL